MILLIDNYDSFVHNLARYLNRLGQQTVVVRNDAITIAEIERMAPAAIVLSPGPCAPQQAGCSLDVVRSLGHAMPILGVCLGHQVIAEAYGGRIVRAGEPFHGRTSGVEHDGDGIFAGLPSPFTACRYHSLIVERGTLPDCLEASAWTTEGVIMGIRHRSHRCVGVQFHPEAVLTEHGYLLLENFLGVADLGAVRAPIDTTEVILQPKRAVSQPKTPVSF